MAGCRAFPQNPPAEKDGRLFGVVDGQFRHRWWNYYERGKSFANGGFHDRAEIDYREAIRQNPADQRRVPTYGRHLADYFPRRELGISLYRRGRFRQAVRELEQSLETETSARAQFYLDRARKAWIEKEALDKEAPKIQLHYPAPKLVTNALNLTISGTASDDTFLKGLTVNGRPIRMAVSRAKLGFEAEVSLLPGENVIRVVAADLLEKTRSREATVFCDRAGPEVSLRMVNGKIKGYARDPSGIARVEVNGEPIRPGRVRGAGVSIDAVAKGEVVAAVWDHAGNVTRLKPVQETSQPSAYRGFVDGEEGVPVFPPEKTGRYYALIIGINQYQNGWPMLRTAKADAQALADVLRRQYGFAGIRLLLDRDATGKRILSEMKQLARCLKESDHLLIYFAGHGELDELSGDGYWIPTDGTAQQSREWITNSAVRSILGGPEAKLNHLLVIADSCYSGSLLRSDDLPESVARSNGLGQARGGRSTGNVSNAIPKETLLLLSGLRKSRQVITSGGLAPVSDAGSGAHSPFAHALLRTLRQNKEKLLDAEQLHARIWESLSNTFQRPQYGRMRVAGESEGQFLFHRHSGTGSSGFPPCGTEDVSFPDGTPPVLNLGFPQSSHFTFLDRAVLSIHGEDENGIQWITVSVNGESPAQSLLERPARQSVHASRIVPLKPGENFIQVQCADQLGNIQKRFLVITREIPPPFKISRRMPLIFGPLQETGLPSPTNVENWLWDELAGLERFNLYSQRRQPSPANPHFLLNGTVLAWEHQDANRERLEITVDISDPEEGSTPLQTLDVYGEGKVGPELLRRKAEELALKIVDSFPQVRGEVSRLEPPEAVLDRGTKDRVFPGLRVLFFEMDHAAGAPPGAIREMGEGRIDSVEGRKSRTSVDDISRLQPAMQFIVR
jgi:hypothetical protein